MKHFKINSKIRLPDQDSNPPLHNETAVHYTIDPYALSPQKNRLMIYDAILFYFFFFIQITPYKASEATVCVRGYSSLLVATAEAEATTRTGRQHTHACTHTQSPDNHLLHICWEVFQKLFVCVSCGEICVCVQCVMHECMCGVHGMWVYSPAESWYNSIFEHMTGDILL